MERGRSLRAAVKRVGDIGVASFDILCCGFCGEKDGWFWVCDECFEEIW